MSHVGCQPNRAAGQAVKGFEPERCKLVLGCNLRMCVARSSWRVMTKRLLVSYAYSLWNPCSRTPHARANCRCDDVPAHYQDDQCPRPSVSRRLRMQAGSDATRQARCYDSRLLDPPIAGREGSPGCSNNY